MKKIFLALPVMLLAIACHQGEELPSETSPGNGTESDSTFRKPKATDTDSMIEPRTGKPKTEETDTI